MANAFERDVGGASYPWAEYPTNVAAWVAELAALPPDARSRERMVAHPDGRRWIGHRAGTYLIDQAVRTSGLSAAQLAQTSTEQVRQLALASRPK